MYCPWPPSRCGATTFQRATAVAAAFGWIFAAHQIGGGFAAWAAGLIRDGSGTYDGVFVASGLLCFTAGLMLAAVRTPRRRPAVATT